MTLNGILPDQFNKQFKIYHELMPFKIDEILLVSSPYDAFILEEDGSLASRFVNQYRGLNLSQPPRVIRTSSANEALDILRSRKIDMVLAMPHLYEMDAFSFGRKIKEIKPDLPVILLSHSIKAIDSYSKDINRKGLDKVFIWSGNSDLLLALVKNVEDHLNVKLDTQKAMVRVLLLVEDSPVYYSRFLPLIYKEVVKQTQAVLEGSLNEEHRLLRMRARPKILLADNYEEALKLYHQFRPYLFGIISDARFQKNGVLNDNAGLELLSLISKEIPDLPLLMLSNDPRNRKKAEQVSAKFLDKNEPDLLGEINDFFLSHLGFGDFIFRMPDGREISRASNLRTLEEKIALIPDESLWYHAKRNHFSNWIMGRMEISLASFFREVQAGKFKSANEIRQYILYNIHALRKWRQKGVVTKFNRKNFDHHIMDFSKIGQGSLGGKARGLAFMSALLRQNKKTFLKYENINIQVPKALVISTDGFEDFISKNRLQNFAIQDVPDEKIAHAFLMTEMPDWLVKDLKAFIEHISYPISVRSSSLLEDSHLQPFAGLYKTYMLPNNQPQPSVRLESLITAIKLVYASTYYQAPKAFSKSVASHPYEEQMAVIIQQLAGQEYKNYFFPSLAGVAHSHNFYPIPPMKPEDGIANIVMGLGKTVVEGGRSLRFCPRYPKIMPQCSSVDDILKNTQRSFYALKIKDYSAGLDLFQSSALEKRSVADIKGELPVKALAGTYIPEEHRIRDSAYLNGPKILTFAQILKYETFPLASILCDFLELGQKGLGCPVEMEFAINLNHAKKQSGDFFFLQIRPMAADREDFDIRILQDDIDKSFCYSSKSLGNGRYDTIKDIIYVKRDTFKAEDTLRIAEEIGQLNGVLIKEKRPYLLVGPGRWGSSDKWLGIPVQWHHISGIGAIIEINNEQINSEPSQGSHFCHNITALGLPHLTINSDQEDFFDWDWVESLPAKTETIYLRHLKLNRPLILKIDGKRSQGVAFKEGSGKGRLPSA